MPPAPASPDGTRAESRSPGAGDRGEPTAGHSTWRNRGLIGLLVSQGISSLGSQMTFLALPWFVLATTGSPTRMGLVLAAEILPVIASSMPELMM